MPGPPKKVFTLTHRTVKSRGKVISERYRRKVRKNWEAGNEIKEFWDKTPLKKEKR